MKTKVVRNYFGRPHEMLQELATMAEESGNTRLADVWRTNLRRINDGKVEIQ